MSAGVSTLPGVGTRIVLENRDIAPYYNHDMLRAIRKYRTATDTRNALTIYSRPSLDDEYRSQTFVCAPKLFGATMMRISSSLGILSRIKVGSRVPRALGASAPQGA